MMLIFALVSIIAYLELRPRPPTVDGMRPLRSIWMGTNLLRVLCSPTTDAEAVAAELPHGSAKQRAFLSPDQLVQILTPHVTAADAAKVVLPSSAASACEWCSLSLLTRGM